MTLLSTGVDWLLLARWKRKGMRDWNGRRMTTHTHHRRYPPHHHCSCSVIRQHFAHFTTLLPVLHMSGFEDASVKHCTYNIPHSSDHDNEPKMIYIWLRTVNYVSQCVVKKKPSAAEVVGLRASSLAEEQPRATKSSLHRIQPCSSPNLVTNPPYQLLLLLSVYSKNKDSKTWTRLNTSCLGPLVACSASIRLCLDRTPVRVHSRQR
ncbi:hypothetical protein AUEXF2481DRAFT_120042 [Aureobasidium subglaciale EXF-2481]|uniref:Uncharacterized protein n=1 Tax=Aureobasidium subglaciale (strain EXF-2481) TaxID=1043005 RepID=A0A074Z1I4_AURSE|nr:uncharacterized protein AUEXF2481DRAFT_120042 [Aureobasidium subglaciale EXF-2481]KER00168.1 hypothetical protein AUEXF2481DRAFT_120042 [Aureobasidium subglaciale EXF-2481]